MKNLAYRTLLCLVPFTTLTGSVFASGSTTCVTEDGISIHVPQGRVVGSPLIGDVTLAQTGKPEVVYPQLQVVNYWIESDELKVRATDDQAMEEALLIKITNLRDAKGYTKGQMFLKAKLPNGTVLSRKNAKVRCEYE